MGKVPDIKRISIEDFPQEYKPLVEKLAFPLNSFMEQIRNLFDKNIDFSNLNQELITLKVQTNENSKPLSNLTFKSALRNKVRGIVVLSANITSSNNTFPSQAPFISFSQNLSTVTISNISGLAPETTYELLLLTIS